MSNRLGFLLGAGFSKDAGLPTSVDLVALLRATLEDAADADSESREVAYLAILNFVLGGIRFQRGVAGENPDSPINIEQVAIAVLRLASRSRNPVAPYVVGWHERLLHLEGATGGGLQGFLDYIYERLAEWLTPEDREAIAYMAALAEYAREHGGVDVFTLNYDLCVEEALEAIANVPFCNGFTDAGWSPSNLDRSDELVRLIKLHGSLDWLDDPHEHGICASRYPEYREIDELPDAIRPLLIFGTDAKVSARDPFLPLLYRFSSALEKLSVLVVIGYGFADEYVNDLLLQRMRANPNLRLVVVAPDAPQVTTELVGFDNTAIVQPVAATAKEVLTGAALKTRVRELMRDGSGEGPFGSDDRS